MEGQYTTIVADFSSLRGQNYEMSICTLSVMGTIYTRVNAVQSNVEVAFKNEKKVLNVERIQLHPGL